ncbi:protein SSUH2 homolog isoform X2 [Oxyura jamaicensis]|uniref:protein SSUH2 homolog isoform X2 n=1 Tax=Oxyura jamaicensis TaxID=8884 RepID=UPI0015A53B86|nr:protein SSUH2 homolog isoform X2 [Oxyura jamaicensis]
MVGDLLHGTGHCATPRAKEVSFISCHSDNPHQSLQCCALMTGTPSSPAISFAPRAAAGGRAGAKPVAPPLGLPGELGQQRISPPFPQPRPLERAQSSNLLVLVPRSVPPLTEAAARRALLRFVAARRCYGSRAAAELVIRELRPRVTYRYRLETFSESRLSEWAFEPFTKLGASRPPGDTPPDLWDVEVGVPPLFQGQTRRCRVPRSALVRECHRCHGRGRSQCGACHGSGRARCVTCRGSRRRLKQQKRCQPCSGTGRSRRNNVFEFVSEHHPNFPGELLSKVSGENIFKDENVVVYPIVDFPEPAISWASRRAIAEHSAAFASSSRILRQRQTVERIPITEVHYQYSGKPYLYYIYGLENKVYALDYPERCCCGCTIV